MTFALTFPGQGSQFVGMGKDLAENFSAAREAFEEVDEALSQRLSRSMWEGPEADLTLTENAQPALMAVSLAVMRVLAAEYGEAFVSGAAFAAGHSLGEYSALAAMRSLSLADTARLLRLRGAAMQHAVPAGQGAMLALLGVDVEVAEKIAGAAGEGEICEVANDNAPGQAVISGTKAAIGRALALSGDYGVRRAIPLTVSAPFHCALMQPAANRMAEALASAAIRTPRQAVISNVTARPMLAPPEIRRLLVQQVTSVVRWRESMSYLADQGITTLFEIGAGRVLTGLARRIDRRLDARAAGTPDDVKAIGCWLGGRAAA
jgi:[acyl-carrier-protein] S-malonyltransferase